MAASTANFRHTDQRINNSNLNDAFQVIYSKGQWRISMVSPLYNFQYSEVKLKQYSFKIKNSIINSIKAPYHFNVQIKSNPDIKYRDSDEDAVIISVLMKPIEGSEDETLVYEGIFLSWGRHKDVPGAVHLPYMLERGKQTVGHTVKLVLNQIFDCNITQFTFTQIQLLRFTFFLAERYPEDSERDMYLHCTLFPHKAKHRLDVGFQVSNVAEIWRRVQEMNEDKKKEDLILLTYQALQNHIYKELQLDLTILHLTKITFSKAQVNENGVVKMKDCNMIVAVFSVLNEM